MRSNPLLRTQSHPFGTLVRKKVSIACEFSCCYTCEASREAIALHEVLLACFAVLRVASLTSRVARKKVAQIVRSKDAISEAKYPC